MTEPRIHFGGGLTKQQRASVERWCRAHMRAEYQRGRAEGYKDDAAVMAAIPEAYAQGRADSLREAEERVRALPTTHPGDDGSCPWIEKFAVLAILDPETWTEADIPVATHEPWDPAEPPALDVEEVMWALHETAPRNHNIGEGPARAICASAESHRPRAEKMVARLAREGSVQVDNPITRAEPPALDVDVLPDGICDLTGAKHSDLVERRMVKRLMRGNAEYARLTREGSE